MEYGRSPKEIAEDRVLNAIDTATDLYNDHVKRVGNLKTKYTETVKDFIDRGYKLIESQDISETWAKDAHSYGVFGLYGILKM